MEIPVGIHGAGPQTGGPQGMAGPQTGGWQTGGAQKFLLNIGSLGAGASIPAIIADGIPIAAPQIFVHAPSNAPHIPKGDGGPVGPHVGGAHVGGAQGAGAQNGATSIGGPPATPETIETENKSVVKNAKIATTLSAIPDPPFV